MLDDGTCDRYQSRPPACSGQHAAIGCANAVDTHLNWVQSPGHVDIIDRTVRSGVWKSESRRATGAVKPAGRAHDRQCGLGLLLASRARLHPLPSDRSTPGLRASRLRKPMGILQTPDGRRRGRTPLFTSAANALPQRVPRGLSVLACGEGASRAAPPRRARAGPAGLCNLRRGCCFRPTWRRL